MAVMIQSPIHLWHAVLPSIDRRDVKYPVLPTQHASSCAYITLPPDTDLQCWLGPSDPSSFMLFSTSFCAAFLKTLKKKRDFMCNISLLQGQRDLYTTRHFHSSFWDRWDTLFFLSPIGGLVGVRNDGVLSWLWLFVPNSVPLGPKCACFPPCAKMDK